MGDATTVGQKGEFYSTAVFITLWEAFQKLYKEKEIFALRWILRDEATLKLFFETILESNFQRVSKGLLYNGYRNCHTTPLPMFSSRSWSQIDDIFQYHTCLLNLPKPVRFFMKQLLLPQTSLCALREKLQVNWNSDTSFSKWEEEVQEVSTPIKQTCKNCFLGNWDENMLSSFKPEAVAAFTRHPTQFRIIDKRHDYCAFYDHSSGEKVLVAMVMKNQGLSIKNKNFLRTGFVELFAAHPALRRGRGKSSLHSQMKGFGAFNHRWKKIPDKVSFYTHSLKMHKVLSNTFASHQFEDLIDKYSHVELIEVILALYLWRCPQLLECFFNYSTPYLAPTQYEQSEFEKVLGKKGPSLYQLYITKDYCSEIHADVDVMDFTLCYASHPDSQISPIDFVVANYGIRLPIADGDMFAFRSNVPHGTCFRTPTVNAAYVGCVTVNNRLHQLLKRRQRNTL